MKTKKIPPIEYRLLVQHTYDDTLKKPGILFLIETTKQFTNFSYRINIRDRFDGRNLQWTLHGLQAPSMNMPESGTAQFSTVYFDAPRTIHFTLIKNDAVQATAEITILKTSVKASQSAGGFLKIYTDQHLFDHNRPLDIQRPELKPETHRVPAAPQTTTRRKKK
jgi:hypothetical protein